MYGIARRKLSTAALLTALQLVLIASASKAQRRVHTDRPETYCGNQGLGFAVASTLPINATSNIMSLHSAQYGRTTH